MKFDENISILVVEDDEVDIMALKRSFKKEGIKNPTYYAGNGLEALELLRGVAPAVPPPRIVLLDINMPKMTGLEFLEEIRADARLKSLVVFVFTTSRQDRDIVAAYRSQVAAYLVKPADGAQLREAVSGLKNLWSLCEFPEEFGGQKAI